MTPRTRRYLLILGLLALAGLLVLSRWLFHNRFPNFFDREQVDAGEIEKLKNENLNRTQAAEEEGWPQFRGTNRDGWSPGTNFRTDWETNPPKVLWTKPCGAGYSSFAVAADGRLYTMDRADGAERVRCLDAATGDEEWAIKREADYSKLTTGYAGGPRATPTIAGDWLYTVGATGELCAFDVSRQRNGAQFAWRHDLLGEYDAPTPTWGVACSPLVEGNLVILQPGGKRGSVVAFDRITGEPRWTCGTDPSGYSSPVAATLGGVRQIVAVTGKSVLGIRGETGELLWKHPWETQHHGNIAMPVVVGDYVFVSSNYGKGCALIRIAGDGAAQTAKVVYFRPNKLMRNHHSTCVHKDGFLFGFDNAELRCVNLREGTAVEDWPPDDVRNRLGKGSVTLVGDKLLCLSERGSLMLTNSDPANFRLLGRLDKVLTGSECWASPAVFDGKIYLRDATNIVCLVASIPK